MTESPGQANGGPDLKRALRWTRSLLFVSLAFNLLIAGLVAGAVYRFGPARDGLRIGPGGAALTLALPEETRAALRRNIRRIDGSGRAGRAEETARIVAALHNTPFDPKALEDLMMQRNMRRMDWQSRAQSEWIAIVAAMSDAERAVYSGEIEKLMRRWVGARKHGGDARP